ncbi:Hypothetical protein CINCED_3A002629 [Cinara cedri]|uniref:Uncharacterized protein n=1 Tax=Cinara cedri TaxID=506608 RepID=A0A5E4MTX3_9HEMI|nr:Hypothetical protein CINCED_3A002629 [Cinara cedri]
METRIDIKVEISQHSEWLTDLKHTNPKFGEAYLSYAVRALRRGKIPLPKHLLHKYHGPKFACKWRFKWVFQPRYFLFDRKRNTFTGGEEEFHVWPENNSVFIMYYLYNCPVGDIRHHLSFGNELKYDKFYQGYDDLDCVHCQYHY